MSVQVIPSTPALRRAAAAVAARTRLWQGLALPVAIIVLWTVATSANWVDTRILVGPWKVVETAWFHLTHHVLWEGLGYSVARMVSGFVLGGFAGLVLGVLLGASRIGDRLVSPTLNTVKQIALFAWIPLISVWFGMGEPAKVIFIALAVFYPIVFNTYEGVRSVAREHIEVARAFEFTRWQTFRRVILPSSTPQIFTGVRLGLIYAWLATVGAEYFLKAGPGLGNIMIDGRERFLMEQVIFGVTVVGLVGFAVQIIATRLETRLLRWRTRSNA
ncbi:hypothetical protein LBMAG53_33060 [Planctomycetota bacterium]|nr:hypothetical protein LBMAG53_33060 [Planctomycetota bacterium]